LKDKNRTSRLKMKARLEDAPPPSTAPPIVGSIDGTKRQRNHTINYRELTGTQKWSKIELAVLEFYNPMGRFGIG
jgi:hypothetical protein